MKRILTTITLFITSTLPTWADLGKPEPLPGGENIPIDGGLSALLAGGAAFGLKKLNDKRKNRG